MKTMSPIIKATDLIPPESQHHFANFDPSRQAHLDINDLRKFLVAGRKKLAYFRAMQYIRPRPV